MAKSVPRFDEQVVWITGASSGIGAALVHAFAPTGAKLVLSARRTDALDDVRLAARLSEDRVLVLPLDLADMEAIPVAARMAEDHFGRIDVLVNNAGISQRSRVLDTDLAVYRRLMEVDYFGTIALTKALLPGMVARNAGHIATVTSVAGKVGTPLRSGYSAAKFALHGFFEALRAELHGEGIRVTMVVPGFVKTQVSVNALTADGSAQGTMDKAQANAMSAEAAASKIVRAISEGQNEVVFGGRRELMAYHLSRWYPGLLHRMLRRAAVT